MKNENGKFLVIIHTQLEKALGFEIDSQVYFSWLKKGRNRPELIVTSISPFAWHNLYDLEFTLGDTPGSLAAVAEILGNNKINILIAQSRTTTRGERAEWAMSADFSRFDMPPEELNDILRRTIRENPDLKKRICKCNDEEEEEFENYAQIKRSEFHKILKELEEEEDMIPFDQRSTIIQEKQMKEGKVATLEIPQYVMQMLSDEFHTEPQNIDTAVMIADTKRSMLSLWFPHPTEKIAKIFFEIDYKPGSLSKIANFLADKGVDLLETDLNILVAGDRGVWKIAIDINGKPGFPCVYSDCRSIEELERRVATDIKEARIRAVRKIYHVEEVGAWAKKSIRNLPPEREIAIEHGQREEAEQFLQKFFNSFGSNVRAILPYIDKTTFNYLDQIPKSCGIRVITSVVKRRTECLERADKLAEDRPFVEILEVALKTEEDYYTPLEHTRWICDESLFIVLDTDLKKGALGGKDYSIEAKETSKCSGRTKIFERRWNQNKSELEKEMKTTVIRKFFYRSGAHS